MKQARFKIYKQVGIQELVPYKYNVKLFKHLLIAKYTFIYFFFRSYTSHKYNKVKMLLKPFTAPFIYPDTKEVFDNYKQLKDSGKALKVNKVKGKKLFSFRKHQYVQDFKKHLKLYGSGFVKHLISNNLRKDKPIFIRTRSISKYAKHLPTNRSRYFKPRNSDHYNFRTKSYKLKPHRSFKLKYTKIPKISILDTGELSRVPFPTNHLDTSLFTGLNYSKDPKAFEYLLINLHRLYIKLGKVNLSFIKERFFMKLTFKFFNKSITNYYKLVKRYFSQKYRLLSIYFKKHANCLTTRNKYLYLFPLTRFKTIISKIIINFLSKTASLKYTNLTYYYAYHNKFRNYYSQFGHYKQKLLHELNYSNLNNLGWYGLMEYLFPKFFQSDDVVFMRKYYVDRFIINPLIYRKYLGELSRSETLSGFTTSLMTYKQRRDLARFFFKLNKKRFGKPRTKRYHDLGSYYSMTNKLLSILLNRQGNRRRKQAFYFNSHRIKLFQTKLYKVLFSLKRTRDCLPLLRDKSKLDKMFNEGHMNRSSNQLERWVEDLQNNFKMPIRFTKNDNIVGGLDKTGFKLGDIVKVNTTNTSGVQSSSEILPIYSQLVSFRSLHFYLNAFFYFKSGAGSIINAFGKYHFLLDTTLYKFGYIMTKHLLRFHKSSYFKTYNDLNLLKINKIMPIIDNKRLVYIPVNSEYITFNTNPIYIGSPVNLSKANLDAFFDRKLGLYSGPQGRYRKDPRLDFLNFFYSKIPYHERISHNRFHIMRYIQFLKGLKEYITFSFNVDFFTSKYSIFILSTSKLNSLDLNGVLKDIRDKIHSNKVDKLLLGDSNKLSR